MRDDDTADNITARVMVDVLYRPTVSTFSMVSEDPNHCEILTETIDTFHYDCVVVLGYVEHVPQEGYRILGGQGSDLNR